MCCSCLCGHGEGGREAGLSTGRGGRITTCSCARMILGKTAGKAFGQVQRPYHRFTSLSELAHVCRIIWGGGKAGTAMEVRCKKCM